MVRALVYVVPFALALWALIDLSRSEAAERADLPRWAWVAVVILVPVLGPLTWLLVSRSRRAGGGGGAGQARGPRGPNGRPRGGPLAPDDDPDFLWRLEQERRRRGRTEGRDPDSAPPV